MSEPIEPDALERIAAATEKTAAQVEGLYAFARRLVLVIVMAAVVLIYIGWLRASL